MSGSRLPQHPRYRAALGRSSALLAEAETIGGHRTWAGNSRAFGKNDNLAELHPNAVSELLSFLLGFVDCLISGLDFEFIRVFNRIGYVADLIDAFCGKTAENRWDSLEFSYFYGHILRQVVASDRALRVV